MKSDDFKNPPIAELLILLGSNPRKRIVILEGHSDEALWEQHLDLKVVGASYYVAYGKSNVVEYVAQVRSKYLNRVLGVVDRDYGEARRLYDSEFNGIISSSQNDIELDILTFGNFQRCLQASLSSVKLDRSKICSNDLTNIAVCAAAEVGALRKLSKCEELNIDFQCYDFKGRDFSPSKLPNKSWFDPSKLIMKFLDDVANFGKVDNKLELVAKCEVHCAGVEDKISICRGHDVSSVLAILHNYFRKANRSSRNAEDVNDLVLGHISKAEFSQIPVYQDLDNWLAPRVDV